MLHLKFDNQLSMQCYRQRLDTMTYTPQRMVNFPTNLATRSTGILFSHIGKAFSANSIIETSSGVSSKDRFLVFNSNIVKDTSTHMDQH